MGGPTSTTIVLVGDDADTALRALDRLQNVRVASFSGHSDDEVQRWLTGAHSPYVAHDRDPLAHVASAWVEFFDDLVSLGTLDIEVDRTLAALEGGDTTMPDYYIVTGPENLSPTWKHWWLGVLPEAAPSRVILWDDSAPPLAKVLRRLPSGRPWPDPRPWLHGVARSVPDRIGLEGHN